jgi:iron complex outermembrane receptor protein
MKNTKTTLLAGAVLAAWGVHVHAQTAEPVVPKVVITASPLGSHGSDQILTPARVLAGDELRDKLGSSLGETLSHELGVSASGFGAGASRPIIRGLEGSRIKMLENGMSVADVSGLSNDHAVGAESSTARQIEILRGPAALLYGSGAIGGLVNVVNERIATELPEHPSGEFEARYGTADRGLATSGSADGAAGRIALHADGSYRLTDDFRIPGERELGKPASVPSNGRLPHSFTHSASGGMGASLVDDWGHVGASVSTLDNRYGIPTLEGAQIAQKQTRYDVDSLVKHPLAGLETLKFKLGYTDYAHTELDLENVPQTRFSNRSFETRLEAAHAPVAGWHGSVGLQTENTHFAAVSALDATPDTVKPTHSTTAAVFAVEERDFADWQINAGLRHERVRRMPQLTGGLDRTFGLTSASVGAAWTGLKGYSLGLTGSVAQRAPAIEELYSSGPHDATATFDLGNPQLHKETSRNLELSLGNTAGALRWKANLFYNKVHDYIYGYVSGRACDDEGVCGGAGELRERVFRQGDVTMHGFEAEVSGNWRGNGLSWRAYADMAQGRFASGGSLPLQAPKRVGADLAYKQGPVRAGATLVHAFTQSRLADFETTATPAYTQLDAHASYTQRFAGHDLTWFALVRNLLNEDIRLSTSILKDVAPQPARSLVLGVRTRF